MLKAVPRTSLPFWLYIAVDDTFVTTKLLLFSNFYVY